MKKMVAKRDLIRLWRKIIVKPLYWVFLIFLCSNFFLPGYRIYNYETCENAILIAAEKKAELNFDIEIKPYQDFEFKDFPIEINAKHIFIKEVNSGRIIFEKEAHEEVSPASLTKMMTALIVIENCDLNTEVTVNNVQAIGSIMDLRDGEKVNFEDLLKGMLIASGNDAAELLVRSCFENVEYAVLKMNEQTEAWNLKETEFADVTGLIETGHYSSAFNLSAIAEILLRDPKLSEIVRIKELSLVSNDYTRWYALKNTNELLWESEKVQGVKTGYTEKAGGCLVFLYRKGGQRYLITILNSSDRFEDGKKIMDWLD